MLDQGGKFYTTFTGSTDQFESLGQHSEKLLSTMKVDQFGKVVTDAITIYEHNVKKLNLVLFPEVCAIPDFLLLFHIGADISVLREHCMLITQDFMSLRS